jgi:hypothetical protein
LKIDEKTNIITDIYNTIENNYEKQHKNYIDNIDYLTKYYTTKYDEFRKNI